MAMAQRALGPQVEIDWSDIRVICLAPNYKKYDVHAVQVMGANIESWSYRLFANGALYLEEIFRKSVSTSGPDAETGKNPVMVASGKKAAATKALMFALDSAMEKAPKTHRGGQVRRPRGPIRDQPRAEGRESHKTVGGIRLASAACNSVARSSRGGASAKDMSCGRRPA
jgi:hypothetical protein